MEQLVVQVWGQVEVVVDLMIRAPVAGALKSSLSFPRIAMFLSHEFYLI